MKFPFRQGPHLRDNFKNDKMQTTMLKALLFVTGWSILNRFVFFGAEVAIHIAMMLIVASAGGLVTHILFHMLFDKLEKKKFASFKERFFSAKSKVKGGAPFITAIILVLAMQPHTPLYVALMTIVFAELFAKLLFGGYGQNIFNPVAVGLIFNALTFGGTTLTAGLPDAFTMATPLVGLNAANWYMTSQQAALFIASYGGILPMFLGLVPGSVGEVSRFAILLAFAYMAYKKVLDWRLTAFYLGAIIFITTIIGFIIGAGLWYPLVNLLSGAVIFGAVFMATDPVTTPVNRQGKMIFAIFLAMLTLLIRFNSNHLEGFAFSLLIMNMFVPYIDTLTSNVTSENINKKFVSVAASFAVAAIVVVGFTMVMGNIG